MKKRSFLFVGLLLALTAGIFAACNKQKCEVHEYGEWQTVTAATCKEAGLKKRVCKACKEEETAPIQKTAHSYGGWQVVKEATCTANGERQRVCTACGDTQTGAIVSVSGGHSQWSDWAVIKNPTCKETGVKRHYCLECGEYETESVSVDPTAHLYGVWTQTKAPTCGSTGTKIRICADCGTEEEQEIPTNGEHDFSNRTITTVSTCSTNGVETATCPACKTTREFELPLNPHNHKNMGGGTVCPDCHGMLSADLTLNNSSGKWQQSYEKYLDGDFAIEYLFRSTTGPEPFWDSFILTVGPAEYLNGKLTRTQVGEMNFIPSPPGSGSSADFTTYYSPVWDACGNKFNTTWFFDEDGKDLIYQTCMALGPQIRLTVVNHGGVIHVTAVMTVTIEGKEQSCTVTATLNYAGTERFYLSLSGEDSVQTLKQVTLKEGKFASLTEPAKTPKLISNEETAYNNKGFKPNSSDGIKNVQANRYSYKGDFDVVYKFTMDGNPSSDWHSWIFYIYNGNTNFDVAAGQKLYWSGIANGAEPEQFALWHGADYYWRHQTDDNDTFMRKLATADVTLRFVRRNGYITMYGAATAQGASSPFVCWTFMSLDSAAENLITIALTSENSTLTMKEILLYSGEVFTTDNKCVFHQYGDWVTVTEPNCGEAGEEACTCPICGDKDTRVIPAEREHSYGDWETVEEAKCGTEGKKKRVCSDCAHEEFGVIPALSDHTYGDWSQTKEANCTEEGERTRTCSGCGHVDTEVIPVNIYAHTAMQNGVCADCRGMLSGELTINNSTGKAVDVYEKYYEGDFEAVYKLRNTAGADGGWHNYFLTFGPAEYLNGKYEHAMLYNIVPFFPGDLAQYYGSNYAHWQMLGNTYETTWFKDASGNSVDSVMGFQGFMQLGVDVTVTLKRTGEALNVTLYNEVTYNGGKYTCTLTACLHFPGAQRLYVGLTGERNTEVLKQAQLLSGKFVSEQTATVLDGTQTEYENLNGQKNIQGRNDTFDGDFSIEYRFKMNGNPNEAWHSWILYTLTGRSEDMANRYWSNTANGCEPDHGNGELYHNADYAAVQYTGSGNFAQDLATADIALRVTRKDGYITVLGVGIPEGANEPSIFWSFYTVEKKTGEITLRLTSENSVLTMKEVLLYGGGIVSE